MSDPTTTPAAPADVTTTAPTATDNPTQTQGDPADLGDAGKKALKAERDRASTFEKQNRELQAQIDAINRANESAAEKAQREASEAVENAKTATVTAFREAAVKFGGISAEDAELFLTGTDADTLGKQAARLVERTSTAPAPAPRPDLTQGAAGTPAAGDPATDFANFLNGQLAG